MSKISTRPVICQVCRKTFVREEGNFVKVSGGYRHLSCHQQKEKDKNDLETLYDFLDQIWGEKYINYPLIQKQIKQMTEKNRMTVQGITGTLNYLHNVKKKTLKPEMGIIIVAYHYNQARLYYEQKENIKASIISKDELAQEEVEVYINPQRSNKYDRLIDVENLFGGDN